MSKRQWNPQVPIILAVLIMITALAHPLGALTLQQGSEGYVVQLSNGESIRDAWRAIWDARRQSNAPVGVRDVIELGPGVFPFTDIRANPLLHYRSGATDPYAPPLVIRGTGAGTSHVLCPTPSVSDACAISYFGLAFEDLNLLVTNARREPIMRITNADLTLRRVKLVGQSIEPGFYEGAIDVFNGNLTIEDSVLSGNQVVGPKGLLRFAGNRPVYLATIVRSTLAGNNASSVVHISSYHGSSLEVEQSTLVGNNVGVLFQGFANEAVTVSRSILDGNVGATVQLTVTDSFTDAAPLLMDDGAGSRVPQPGSPVVDALPCTAQGFDQRGLSTGVVASYHVPDGTDCDYGAIEAQHQFCMATDHDTVACDEGEIDVAAIAALGCRLIGGLLDCTGGQEAEVTFLDHGESLLVGEAELLMQADGNLVLYDDGVVQWATGTDQGSCIGYFAAVQADGTLAVFSDPQAPGGATACWATGVAGQRVVVRQGFRGAPAQLVVEKADGSAGWIAPYSAVPSGHSFTPQGARFHPGDGLTIPGAAATMEPDGNFVLYDTIDGVETPIWSLDTEDACPGQDAVFQEDGKLVIGAPGAACFFATDPPLGGTVLRLHRTPFGLAALSLYDVHGEVLWSVPEPPTAQAHCGDLPAGSPDGVYTVVDRLGVARQVYCDMSGGGWMLVGKVYRSHAGQSGLPEPADWWTAGTGQVDALLPGTVDWTGGLGVAAYGAAWLADLDPDVARFDLIAELADPFTSIADATPGQTASWYKDASTIDTWFSTADTTPTPVCSGEALACTQTGRIIETGDGTWFEGMRLPMGGGWIHTRPDTDSRAAYDGVCSYTFNDPSWLDSAAEHWGNGLDIWVKKESDQQARCSDFPAGSPDGVYTVVDDAGAARQVYCDMSGGGWMLVGKVYRSHEGQSGLSEPADWWTAGTGQVDALVPGTVDWTAGPNVAAYGATWLNDLGLSVARFDLIAEHADPFTHIADATPGQTASWYKGASTIATWFSAVDTPTAVCSGEALSCADTGRIIETGDGTWFEGMRLSMGGGWIHTRPDSDSRPAYDGVCSYTSNHPDWLDSAADHWGNGLDIWVK